jgi:hypothetical protein
MPMRSTRAATVAMLVGLLLATVGAPIGAARPGAEAAGRS